MERKTVVNLVSRNGLRSNWLIIRKIILSRVSEPNYTTHIYQSKEE